MLGQCRPLSFTVLKEFNDKKLQQDKSKKGLITEKQKQQATLKLRSPSSNGVEGYGEALSVLLVVVLYLPRAAVSPRQLFLGWSLLL